MGFCGTALYLLLLKHCSCSTKEGKHAVMEKFLYRRLLLTEDCKHISCKDSAVLQCMHLPQESVLECSMDAAWIACCANRMSLY